MEDAGLLAAVRAAPAVELPLEVPAKREIGQPGPRSGRLWQPNWFQGTVVVAGTAVAFGQSLGSLFTGFPFLPLGTIGIFPIIAALLAIWVLAARRQPEPAIHDRYLDYILGLGLLGLATAIMVLLPRALSVFFWSWRLDLLAMPILLSGSLTLLSGSRAVWRFRLPIALIFLAWPLPYVASGLIHEWVVIALGPPLVALAALAGLAAKTRHSAGIPKVSHPTQKLPARPRGGLLALVFVLVGVVLCAFSDRDWQSASILIESDGNPYLPAAVTPGALAGLTSVSNSGSSASSPVLATPKSIARYRYDRAPGIASLIDIVAPGDGRELALTPSTLASAQGYRLDRARMIDLGAGLTAHLESYAPKGAASLTVVWWDWPVRWGTEVRRERIIVHQLTPSGVRRGDADDITRLAREFVNTRVPVGRRSRVS